MKFIVYDLIFLVVFGISLTVFLYIRRASLKREMKIAFLYRTKLGIKFIDYIGTKYKRAIKVLRYFSVSTGYLLMAVAVYFALKTVYDYIKYPQITELIKVPPIAPLIPYFPSLFGLESFFPPFYFTYFILAIAIAASVHEFAHGIFAKSEDIKIKSTGVAVFGPFLGAFVEPDEKVMNKKSVFSQLGILSAGVFSNLIFAGLFFLLWWLIFSVNFVPSGATFDTYRSSIVNVSGITNLGGIPVSNLSNDGLIEIINTQQFNQEVTIDLNGSLTNLIKITAEGNSYLIEKNNLKKQLSEREPYVILYDDFPAINAGLRGDIIEINQEKIRTSKELSDYLKNSVPGTNVTILTRDNGEILSFNMVLIKHPDKNGSAIGIISLTGNPRMDEAFALFKSQSTRYVSNSDFLSFIYYLVFWIFLLNFLIAFFNMLPLSIMDGGRFFYLTILGITKNEKLSVKIFSRMGAFLLFLVALLMVVWLVRIV